MRCGLVIALCLLVAAPAAAQVTDDFEDGTTEGWAVGIDPQPVHVADGGPTGAGDGYLLATSLGGGGAHSKLAVFNLAQWTGDWTAAGRTTIYLHARNLGATDLVLRLAFGDPTSIDAVTTAGVALPAGGGWRLVTFDVSAAGLTGADVAATLAAVERLWIYHSGGASFPGPPIAAQLGVDNVSDVPLAPMCGDGVVNGGDVCDAPDLDGHDCTDHGYVNPAGLGCAATCDAYVTTGCTASCGNGTAEPGEPCDTGGDSASCDADCTAVSCGDGACNGAAGEDAVTCAADCPTTCGDALITGGEVCDGANLAGQDCTDHGYVAPAGLACAAGCAAFDTSGCAAVCGNSTPEPGESCDTGGDSPGCDGDCTAVSCGDGRCNAAAGEDAATCIDDCGTVCGDALVTGAEVCDGANLAGQDCTDHGYVASAGLACAASCDGFDTDGCTAACGNSVAEPGEDCDDGGVDTLSCDASCAAVVCGDGAITGAEVCDGAELGGQDCTDHGFVGAAGLACAAGCDGVLTAGCAAACGNGAQEPGEPCDGGGADTATCDADCTLPACGDGDCNAAAGESQDSCSDDCGLPPDAGAPDPDAAVPDPDAGTVDPDAGTGSPDGGLPPIGPAGGCCSTGGGPGEGLLAALTLLGLLATRGRGRSARR